MGRLSYISQYQSLYTRRNYADSLKRFFEVIYGDSSSDLEDLAERYFNEGRNYRKDVEDFFVSMNNKPPKTIQVRLSCIKTFLLENGVDIEAKFWKRLAGRIKGTRAITLDKVPTPEQLRKIITHLDVEGKAFFLILASSGMRIGEAVQLTFNDIELDKDPAVVRIRGDYAKTGNSRITFISKEAKESLLEYLKIREQKNKARNKRGRKTDEPVRIFPASRFNYNYKWRLALDKSGNGGIDPKTRIREYHIHVLRKWFRTRLAIAIPVDIVEALMGHEGYLTEVYRRYSEEDLAKFYKQGEHQLLIFTEAGEVSKLKQEVEEKNRQLQQIINELNLEKIELKTQMNEMKLENLELKNRIKRVEEEILKLIEYIKKN